MKRNEMFYHAVIAGALLVVTVIFGLDVFAADQNPCSEDMAKFCKNIKPGQQALMECLEQHEAQLSDACKNYEMKMEKSRSESREVARQQMRVRQACRNDVTQFCNDPKSGNAGLIACLNAHTDALSAQCRDALRAAKGGAEEKTAK